MTNCYYLPREIDAGSDGLFFTPYLTGERTPYPDPYARAGFIGLTRQHTRAHLTRAVLEGVAFGLKDCFELIKAAGLGEIRQVRVSGGGAKSPLWRQILADVLDTELVMVNTSEGAPMVLRSWLLWVWVSGNLFRRPAKAR